MLRNQVKRVVSIRHNSSSAKPPATDIEALLNRVKSLTSGIKDLKTGNDRSRGGNRGGFRGNNRDGNNGNQRRTAFQRRTREDTIREKFQINTQSGDNAAPKGPSGTSAFKKLDESTSPEFFFQSDSKSSPVNIDKAQELRRRFGQSEFKGGDRPRFNREGGERPRFNRQEGGDRARSNRNRQEGGDRPARFRNNNNRFQDRSSSDAPATENATPQFRGRGERTTRAPSSLRSRGPGGGARRGPGGPRRGPSGPRGARGGSGRSRGRPEGAPELAVNENLALLGSKYVPTPPTKASLIANSPLLSNAPQSRVLRAVRSAIKDGNTDLGAVFRGELRVPDLSVHAKHLKSTNMKFNASVVMNALNSNNTIDIATKIKILGPLVGAAPAKELPMPFKEIQG